MPPLKVMTVFGTRPEAVKMAPLVLALRRTPGVETCCAVTAQHREMLDGVLALFSLTPDYDLNIMEESQSLSTITTKALTGMDALLAEVCPDLVLVHGDTSTTLAGALSAFYHKVKIGHVEAGLRTGDKYAPYPEEANRRLVGVLADLHFCPTAQNRENLRREGVTEGVFVTGNTVIDALRLTVRDDYGFRTPALAALPSDARVLLVTAHRRENYGEGFVNIFWALRDLVTCYQDIHIVLPVHLNPAVRETANRILDHVPRIHLIDPLPVDELHNLMARCYFVLTDSGGLQEEAPALGCPVLVMRRETERPEAVEAGTVRMAGADRRDIVAMAATLLDNAAEYTKMAKAVNPYGDGEACRRIVEAVLYHYGLRAAPPDVFDAGGTSKGGVSS
ncbi:MAG: UDP-N-acetylglucosamine 2-epimerase (non-hydrolyzing) [Oscillospiraceae bacterium]|jgi:UDP-N-acetylglucosamine 2-epimerase|nr:UDP-N-acetylglucosamine 2-epimerase (non-hydrolyzing) [Oscillospiraceae bacterium]